MALVDDAVRHLNEVRLNASLKDAITQTLQAVIVSQTRAVPARQTDAPALQLERLRKYATSQPSALSVSTITGQSPFCDSFFGGAVAEAICEVGTAAKTSSG